MFRVFSALLSLLVLSVNYDLVKSDHGTVALVIGGIQTSSFHDFNTTNTCGSDPAVTQLDSVEIFGCPSDVDPILSPLPSPATLAGGTF